MPAIFLNLSAQVSYYLVMNKFMFKQSVKLFYFPRVLLAYMMIQFGHEQIFVKRYMMENYRVNVNDLFDQDEPFLFNNIEFRRLIKRMHDRYVHLVNPNFDLSQIV